MKLLPDSVRCHISRVCTGSKAVYPEIARRIPIDKIASGRWQMAVMPAVVIGPWILAFNAPKTLFLLVPAWAAFAWHIGHCPHCPERTPSRDQSADEPHEEAAA